LQTANHVPRHINKSPTGTGLVSPILDGCMSPLAGRKSQTGSQSPRLISSPFAGLRLGCHTVPTKPLTSGAVPQQRDESPLNSPHGRHGPGEHDLAAKKPMDPTYFRVPHLLAGTNNRSNERRAARMSPHRAIGLESSCMRAGHCGLVDIEPQTMKRQKRLRALDNLDIGQIEHRGGNALVTGTGSPRRAAHSPIGLGIAHTVPKWSTFCRQPMHASAAVLDNGSSPLLSVVPLSGRDEGTRKKSLKTAADTRRCCSEGARRDPSPVSVDPGHQKNRKSYSAAVPREAEPESSTGWCVWPLRCA
jgi:hypothetical protein